MSNLNIYRKTDENIAETIQMYISTCRNQLGTTTYLAGNQIKIEDLTEFGYPWITYQRLANNLLPNFNLHIWNITGINNVLNEIQNKLNSEEKPRDKFLSI